MKFAIAFLATIAFVVDPSSSASTLTTAATATASSSEYIITGWQQSTGTGYSGYTADVMSVSYTSTLVYVTSNSIPSYTIGPWNANPNTPGPQNSVYAFYRTAAEETTSSKSTSLGVVGLWKDGVYIYNANDATSYNSLGVWFQNAFAFEGTSFDSCNGHPDGMSRYHTHVNPVCLYTSSSSSHSPLLGFMLDGYPIYGPYGYSNANSSTSSIELMVSGYSLRNITQRTTLANGTILSSAYYGPDVSTTYPLGDYLDDYSWSASTGSLDAHNGRWCVTPEYPSGTYAYFVTIDSSGALQYPYTIGTTYYGKVYSTQKMTVPSTATNYF